MDSIYVSTKNIKMQKCISENVAYDAIDIVQEIYSIIVLT